MKKLLFILFFIPLLCHAQNSVNVLLQTSNLAPGIRYDHRFNRTGVYIQSTSGTYQSIYFEPLKEQTLSIGAIFLNKAKNTGLTAGVSYNQYSEDWGDMTTYPVSIEFGTVAYFDHFTVLCCTDLLKWKFLFGIGLNF